VRHPWRRLSTDARIAVAIRLGLFLVCLASAAAANGTDDLKWFAPLAGAILLSTATPNVRNVVLAAGIVEGGVAAIVVVGSGGQDSPILPYLIAASAATAMRIGELGAVPPSGTAALVLLGGPIVQEVHDFRSYTAAAAQWVVLSLLAGLATGRLHTMTRREGGDQRESYEAAHRLLSQLRTVARQLAAGLDPVTLADGLLEAMHAVVPFDRGAVYARSQGGRLVPLAIRGTDRIDWDVNLSGDNAFAEAWASQRAAVATRAHRSLSDSRRRPGSSIAVPVSAGVRTIGVVGLEASVPWQLNKTSLEALEEVAAQFGLRMETALLFDEVREVATVEERRRLAREIHDGIAQELASLGYVIDGMTADARDEQLADQLRRLRQELTRIISEIRLSIFDLRSEVDQYGGLGAALSEYVRSVGTQSQLRVHLTLDEGPVRLPAEVEAELLRIAQEAITNARKHANAQNLWVNCSVVPPSAWLRVEDDGVGLQTGREDSFGIEIMRERAARLHARLDISPGEAGGTVVEVALGAKLDTDTVALPRNR
jgi:signal transduction histidine kinase